MEEIYKDWKVSPTPETVSTSVNGILGASCDFWDEDKEEEDGPRSFVSRSRNGSRSFRPDHSVFVDDYPVGTGATGQGEISYG